MGKDDLPASGGKGGSEAGEKRTPPAAIVGWLAMYLALSGVVLGVLVFWASRHDVAWGGLGGELAGYLPILVMFAPPIALSPFLWSWLR